MWKEPTGTILLVVQIGNANTMDEETYRLMFRFSFESIFKMSPFVLHFFHEFFKSFLIMQFF